jgi:CO/xanthine dehydrogenase Mo-binding subunit
METHTHVIRPIENGEFEVYPATQMPHTIHVFLSGVLKIPANKFDVKASFEETNIPTLF